MSRKGVRKGTQWDRTIELLLANWSQQISINEMEYRKRAKKYNVIYNVVNGSMIISMTVSLATIINIIVYSVYSNIIYLCMILDGAALTLTVLNAFFNFGSSHTQYFAAAVAHNNFRNSIDAVVSLRREDRGDAKRVLFRIRDEFNKIKQESPPLPHNAVIHSLDMCIYADPKDACGNKNVTFGMLYPSAPQPTIQANSQTQVVDTTIPLNTNSEGSGEHVVIDMPSIASARPAEKVLVSKDSISSHNTHLKQLELEWQRLQNHFDYD